MKVTKDEAILVDTETFCVSLEDERVLVTTIEDMLIFNVAHTDELITALEVMIREMEEE